MSRLFIIHLTLSFLLLAGCSPPTTALPPTASPSPGSHTVQVIEYPPLDWSANEQVFQELGCVGKLPEACHELIALGCDEIHAPRFLLSGLQPPYAVMECIHEGEEPPDPAYFRQLDGLDPRYRSFVIYQDGAYRLIIKKSEFKAIFAPIESTQEALSYAMAMTGLKARFDFNPNEALNYQVEVIEETHAEETAEGYLVSLFDWSHRMGCDIHPFYAVTILVTRGGEVIEKQRQEIYRGDACFDFEALQLEDK
jgi:hypothetical protein